MKDTLAEAVVRKARESATAINTLFERDAARLVACARALGSVFEGGGRLFVFGNGGSACDAAHVAVEFQHPIIEKRKALRAIALSQDAALLSALGNDEDFALAFARQLALHATPKDAALAFSTSGKSRNVVRALRAAREMGMLTILFAGGDGGTAHEAADHVFVAPSFSIHRIQECHTALLHILWDLVHLARGEEDVV